MKVPFSISVTSNVEFPVEVIEEFVNARLEHKAEGHVYQPQPSAPVLEDFEHIYSCSSHITVNGYIEMSPADDADAVSRLYVDSRYCFTCVRSGKDLYRMAWASSLN
jgi:hypothetical protein